MDVFRIIAQNHKQRLPTLSMDTYSFETCIIHPHTLQDFEELMGFKFKFRELGLELYTHEQSTSESGVMEALGNRILDRASEWLDFQSENLVRLHLIHFIRTGTLILPVFPHLTVLFLQLDEFEEESESLSIRPLTADHFPVLRELTMYTYGKNYSKIFAQARLTSVESLYFYPNYDVSFSPVWKDILPNLTTLNHAEIENPPETAWKTVTCILTHYSELQHLSLSLPTDKSTNEEGLSVNYWEILTGGAPRPLDTRTLLTGELSSGHVELEAIGGNGGIIQVPSLQNMRGILCYFE